MFEHLAANGVDLAAIPTQIVQLGVALTMDPKSERFLGHNAANEMLTRPYRKPYLVPEKV
jgi:hypothetical protein